MTDHLTLRNTPITALPFVSIKRGVPHYWQVTPTNDYGAACAKGREYAAHLAQYVKDNPAAVGLFALIVGAIDHTDATPAKGYRVGFLAHWARLAAQRAAEIEVFADLYSENMRYANAADHAEA
jgi:hypothetical protein